jgi:hypothetical protein
LFSLDEAQKYLLPVFKKILKNKKLEESDLEKINFFLDEYNTKLGLIEQ